MSSYLARETFAHMCRDALGALTSIFFPGDCRLCKQLLTTASRLPICDKCLASFTVIGAPICQLCGQPEKGQAAEHEVSSLCVACQEQPYGFHVARSFGVYEGALARAIVLLKFEGIEPLGEWFRETTGECCTGKRRLLGGGRRSPRAASPEPAKRARIQPGGIVCAAAIKAIGNSLSAGSLDADSPTSRETPAGD